MNLRTNSLQFLRNRDSIEKPDLSDSVNIPHYLQHLTSAEDNGKRIFGLPLETVMIRSVNENYSAPKIIHKLAEYLENCEALKLEGIFRLCGNQNNISNLIKEIDSGESVDLSNYNVHEIANVFKLYFQLLPEPIFTLKLYPRFMAAVCLEDVELRNKYYNSLLVTLPKTSKKAAIFLINFLKKVVDEKKSNRMGAKNLGIVFGPLLLRREKQDDDVYKSFLHYSKYIINCAKHMISSFDELFIDVPPVEVVRTLTSYTAKKLGELDLKENSEIYIFVKSSDDCFAESNGRFGTLPTHFLYSSDGKLKCSTTPRSPKKPRNSPARHQRQKRSLSYRGVCIIYFYFQSLFTNLFF